MRINILNLGSTLWSALSAHNHALFVNITYESNELIQKLERFSGFAVGIWGGLFITFIFIFIVSILS